MASTARMEKQLDREFTIKKVPNGSLVVIHYADALGAVIPEKLQGTWTSEAQANKAIADWRDSLSKQLET